MRVLWPGDSAETRSSLQGGMPDWWENLHGLDPFDPSDADEDPDGDGATNLEEYLRGTDPNFNDDFLFKDGFES